MNLRISFLALPLLALACAHQPETSKAAGQVVASSTCLKETGSRIKAANGSCTDRGHVLDREDIERSGSVTTADAIRRNVPSAR